MKTITTLLILFIFMASCHKDDDTTTTQTDENGVITLLPYQWKKSLHLNGVVSNGIIRKAIYYNNNIAIPTTEGKDKRFLTLINTNDGKTLWKWNDSYLPYSNQIEIYYLYQYNNLLY